MTPQKYIRLYSKHYDKFLKGGCLFISRRDPSRRVNFLIRMKKNVYKLSYANSYIFLGNQFKFIQKEKYKMNSLAENTTQKRKQILNFTSFIGTWFFFGFTLTVV